MNPEAVSEPADLGAWARAAAPRIVEADGLSIDLEIVSFEVSTRAKRRAGACIYERVDDAKVGRPVLDAPESTVRLTWAAWDALGERAMRDVLRHELLHVEEVQAFGTTTHGTRFSTRAGELGVPLHCERFTEPNYRLTCTDCGSVVAERYKKSKLVSRAEEYRSSCCRADLDVVGLD